MATATAKPPLRNAPAPAAPTLAAAFDLLCGALLAGHDHDPVTQAQLRESRRAYAMTPVLAWRQVLQILEGAVGQPIRTAQ